MPAGVQRYGSTSEGQISTEILSKKGFWLAGMREVMEKER